ncbi:MAG: hypothetical protein LBL46_04925 [Rickettsiales bacterium]|jgi:hypothetical protein|nr:hypothetical protein [Rickettsiales bacterium]
MTGWESAFSVAWAVPLVLDAVVSTAAAVYEAFVGGGILAALIWGMLAVSIGLYLMKMYFPAPWVEFFGFTGGGEMIKGIGGFQIAESVLKRMVRAIIAVSVLLQITPKNITEYLIEPFLQFGSVYVDSIAKVVLPGAAATPAPKCPASMTDFISVKSCEFLTKTIDQVSLANNGIISKGLSFIGNGIAKIALVVTLGDGLLSLITGILLVFAFFTNNLFMTLMIVRGIFKFGIALILYPFKVLMFVVKDADKSWGNPMPAFADILDALKKLVVAMIAVAFVLMINISVAGALTGLDPNSAGFGALSATWLSAILTFWIMQRVFAITQEKLESLVSDKDMTGFYGQVKGDAMNLAGGVKKYGGKAWEVVKKMK